MIGTVVGLDFLVIALFVVIGLGIPAWAVVDAISRPTDAFAAAGSSKALWIALVLGFWFVTGILGVILAGYYLVVIRPRVMAVMR